LKLRLYDVNQFADAKLPVLRAEQFRALLRASSMAQVQARHRIQGP
jgi:hypothetical protein